MEDMISKLKKAFPDITGIKDAAEWSGDYEPGQVIHLGDAAEGGLIDDLPACDYNAWEHDPQERIYRAGVLLPLADMLEAGGWWVDCHDPGTYLAFKEGDY